MYGGSISYVFVDLVGTRLVRFDILMLLLACSVPAMCNNPMFMYLSVPPLSVLNSRIIKYGLFDHSDQCMFASHRR